MFRFENPEYLYILFVIPVLAALFVFMNWREHRKRKRLCDDALFHVLVPNYSGKRHVTKFVLLLTALALLVVMLARPQTGLSEEKDENQGIEVAFVVDVSNSMLAQDVLPNRLERSKLLVSTLVDKMRNDKIALAVFAGEAYPQLPITNDYASAKLFLDNFTPGMVTLQGTSIAKAIELGRISFTDDKEVGKAIVIITDGEDHEDGALEAAKEAKKEGIKVYVLGVGSGKGTKIPLPDGTNLRDSGGREVITILNEKMCQEIAQAGGGAFYRIDNTNAAQKNLQSELSNLKKSSSSTKFSLRDEQFQAVALIALMLILVEYFILERKNLFIKRLKLFRR